MTKLIGLPTEDQIKKLPQWTPTAITSIVLAQFDPATLFGAATLSNNDYTVNFTDAGFCLSEAKPNDATYRGTVFTFDNAMSDGDTLYLGMSDQHPMTMTEGAAFALIWRDSTQDFEMHVGDTINGFTQIFPNMQYTVGDEIAITINNSGLNNINLLKHVYFPVLRLLAGQFRPCLHIGIRQWQCPAHSVLPSPL